MLACAGHVHDHGGRCTDKWLDGAIEREMAGQAVVVKVHPNDREPHPEHVMRMRKGHLVVYADYRTHPRELLRSCRTLYLDYPSTYWLEAKCYGKPVICEGQAEILRNRPIHDVLVAQGEAAVQNIIHVIETEVEKK